MTESGVAPSEPNSLDAASSGLPDFDRIREVFRTSAREPRFRLRPLADIELDTSAQWLIEGLMPAEGLHVLYGAPGTGKSFLALSAVSGDTVNPSGGDTRNPSPLRSRDSSNDRYFDEVSTRDRRAETADENAGRSDGDPAVA